MTILDKLAQTQEFATLPPVAAKVLTLLENEDVDIRYISSIIETDAPLTLKLLKVANSPLFAVRSEITSIHHAIITLGLNRLINIVLGVSIFSKFLLGSQSKAAELMEKFWWHSSCTGMVAKSIANKIKKQFKENEFIGGLLHDIGKLAMLQFDSSKYQKVVDMINIDSITDIEAEKEVFEVSHIEVGERITKLWKLPEELSTIIINHTTPEAAEKYNDLVSIVRFADLLCEIWGADFNEGINQLDVANEKSWQIICNTYPELKDIDIEILTFELEEDFRKSSTFLNILIHEGG